MAAIPVVDEGVIPSVAGVITTVSPVAMGRVAIRISNPSKVTGYLRFDGGAPGVNGAGMPLLPGQSTDVGLMFPAAAPTDNFQGIIKGFFPKATSQDLTQHFFYILEL